MNIQGSRGAFPGLFLPRWAFSHFDSAAPVRSLPRPSAHVRSLPPSTWACQDELIRFCLPAGKSGGGRAPHAGIATSRRGQIIGWCVACGLPVGLSRRMLGGRWHVVSGVRRIRATRGPKTTSPSDPILSSRSTASGRAPAPTPRGKLRRESSSLVDARPSAGSGQALRGGNDQGRTADAPPNSTPFCPRSSARGPKQESSGSPSNGHRLARDGTFEGRRT
jgi:hypothetical protein